MDQRNKTKIVCTIGPASRPPEVLRQLLNAGMNIARLNFSHGDLASHQEDVLRIRKVAAELGKSVAIMADLPGPKIRIGDLAEEVIHLENGQILTLTTETLIGTADKISVTLPSLPQVVDKGKYIFLNDGFIQLQVEVAEGSEVLCRVMVGGPLRSRKGLNVPGVDLGVKAFTAKDREIAEFALGVGVDALSQSFVESALDIRQLREMAKHLGHDPFIIAKIERSKAVHNLDEILQETDGIMVARGDLGVEIPISQIPIVQKEIVHKANRAGKPVITATHMLESMITHIIPTRAEATDVANAILDGTDCVMLSGESAIGEYPVQAVTTLSDIAEEAERARPYFACNNREDQGLPEDTLQIIASSVETVIQQLSPVAVVVPTRSGNTARNISKYRLPVWIFGVSAKKQTCRNLIFSYGIIPFFEPDHPTRWRAWIRDCLHKHNIKGRHVVLTEGPSSKYPDRNDRMEIIDLSRR